MGANLLCMYLMQLSVVYLLQLMLLYNPLGIDSLEETLHLQPQFFVSITAFGDTLIAVADLSFAGSAYFFLNPYRKLH